MRAETFIAERLYFSRSRAERSHSAVRPAVRVALAGMIIGVTVMLVTVCVVVGFKDTVTEKVAGFGAHIQVVNYDDNATYEMNPISVSDSLVRRIQAMDNVASVATFCTKPGIIKTDDAFQGIVLKGTDSWDYFAANLRAGALPASPNEVLLSAELSRRLRLTVGESVLTYFADEQLRARRLVVAGIYETGLGDYDELFVLAMSETVRRLNGWRDDQAAGLEITLADVSRLNETADRVYFATANRLDADGNGLYTRTLCEQNPQIFAWLDLLDMNVVIIILLMLAVSMFTIVSGLIILILDSVTLIGTLKALGADNRFVRRIFVTESAMLVGKGVVWGTVLGLALCVLQYTTHLLPLDAATYYVNYVPIAFPIGWMLVVTLGTVLLSILVLLAPSAIVTRISPAKVMHFE